MPYNYKTRLFSRPSKSRGGRSLLRPVLSPQPSSTWLAPRRCSSQAATTHPRCRIQWGPLGLHPPSLSREPLLFRFPDATLSVVLCSFLHVPACWSPLFRHRPPSLRTAPSPARSCSCKGEPYSDGPKSAFLPPISLEIWIIYNPIARNCFPKSEDSYLSSRFNHYLFEVNTQMQMSVAPLRRSNSLEISTIMPDTETKGVFQWK